MNNRTFEKNKKLVLFSILMAIIAIMGFTPLGYIKILTIEITFITIPVAVCAILLGPWYGALAGLFFGVTSFIQAVSGMSLFGAAIFAVNPFYCFILCIVPRILVGLLPGIFYVYISKFDKKKIWSVVSAAVISCVTNTVFFTLFFCIFFRNAYLEELGIDLAEKSFFQIVALLVTANAAIEIVVCTIVGAALSKALIRFIPQKANNGK